MRVLARTLSPARKALIVAVATHCAVLLGLLLSGQGTRAALWVVTGGFAVLAAGLPWMLLSLCADYIVNPAAWRRTVVAEGVAASESYTCRPIRPTRATSCTASTSSRRCRARPAGPAVRQVPRDARRQGRHPLRSAPPDRHLAGPRRVLHGRRRHRAHAPDAHRGRVRARRRHRVRDGDVRVAASVRRLSCAWSSSPDTRRRPLRRPSRPSAPRPDAPGPPSRR